MFRNDNNEAPKILKFGIMVSREITPEHIEITRIRSHFEGIDMHEAAIITEAWLEKFKAHLKQPIKDDISFSQ